MKFRSSKVLLAVVTICILAFAAVWFFSSGERSIPGEPAVASLPEGPRWNVIILLIDALRRDHLGLYGYSRDTSPFLDQLASQGVVFEDAIALASWTQPSVASLLTSQHPACLRNERSLYDLRRAELPMAVYFHAQGYATGAFLTNRSLVREAGFHLGFGTFVENNAYGLRQKARLLHEQLFPWMLAKKQRPLFVYSHYMEVHGPYRATDEYAYLFLPREYPLPPKAERGFMNLYQQQILIEGKPADITEEKKEEKIALYDACIRQLDDELKKLFSHLQENGLRENSIIWIVSDHGEEFFDHCSVKHSYSLYEEILRIPMILLYPGGPKGQRVRGQVDLRDVMPTTVELLGGDPLALPVEGRSLLPMIEEGAPGKEIILSEANVSHKADRWILSLRTLEEKWLIDRLWGEKRFYNLKEDPGERSYRQEPPDNLKKKFASFIQSWDARCEATFVNPDYSQDFIERLKDLGYLGDSKKGKKPPQTQRAFVECQ